MTWQFVGVNNEMEREMTLWKKIKAYVTTKEAKVSKWLMTSPDGYDWTPTEESRREWLRIHYPQTYEDTK